MTSAIGASARGPAARPLAALVVAALAAVLYAPVLIGLFEDWWTRPEASHGLVIPPLAAYIAWLRRDAMLGQPAAADNRGLALTGMACLVFLIGILGAEFFLPRISLVLLLAGLVWTFWGCRRLRALGFPLALMATAVPLPALVYNSLAAPLQLFASDIAAQCAAALGVSVYRDGNIIELANISLGVEEACSGLNSLSAMMAASVALGFILCRHPLARIALFAASVPLSILINVIRVAGTAVLADRDEAFARGFFHSFSGWLVFMAGFAALYVLARLWAGKAPGHG